MIDTSKGFTIVRTFDATPEELWDAWINADAIADWWRPRDTITPRESVEMDARVGGRYVYTMVNASDPSKGVVTGGVFREMQPYTRLSFTWGYPDGDQNDQPVATVTFEPDGGRTRMTFDLRGVEGKQGDGFFYDGWDQVLDSLETYISTGDAAGYGQ